MNLDTGIGDFRAHYAVLGSGFGDYKGSYAVLEVKTYNYLFLLQMVKQCKIKYEKLNKKIMSYMVMKLILITKIKV